MKTCKPFSWFSWIFALAVTMTLMAAAKATPPESGIWWNQDQSGRGFVIEVQDQYIMISSYAYDTDGEAVFFLSSGQMTSPSFFSGTVLRTSNGQCFNCAYQPPSTAQVGMVMINFTSPWTADMTFLGEFIRIRRFDAVGYLSRTPDVMFGEWATIDGDPDWGFYSGERLTFNSSYIDTDGSLVISGYRTGELTDIALASWLPNTQQLLVLLDSSTSYYRVWRFKYIGFNRLEGEYDLYQKGDTPDYWTPSLASRVNFKNGVKWGLSSKVRTQTSTRTAASAERDETARRQAASFGQSVSKPVTAEEVHAIRALEAHMGVVRARTQNRANMQ